MLLAASCTPAGASAAPSFTATAAPTASPTVAPTPKPLAIITVSSPKEGESVAAGDLTVSYVVSDVTLVPVASAKTPEDYHVHVVLDADTTPYVGTTLALPGGPANPNPDRIMHTAATSVVFKSVAAGPHTLTVWLALSSHVSVYPAVFTKVQFTAK